jgi:DNA-directed RNA polymerase subunit RPC12/RpoP
MASHFTAPPVHMILCAYPPAPARVGLVYRPLPLRLIRAAAVALFFFAPAPASFWLPPHYPWPVLLVATGAWLTYRVTRPYQVRWFVGMCPRCGRELELPRGTPIQLPHGIGCCHCHFQSALEAYDEVAEERVSANDGHLRHDHRDCPGAWREERIWNLPYLACPACGARHHATPALRAAAAAEERHGRILLQLTEEGRYLS